MSHLLGRHIKADCPQVNFLVGVNTGDYEEDPGALKNINFHFIKPDLSITPRQTYLDKFYLCSSLHKASKAKNHSSFIFLYYLE